MDIKDLMKDIKTLPSYQIERRLEELVRQNYRFKNLSDQNKGLILDLIHKYKDRLRSGEHITSTMIQRDTYQLYERRSALHLTENDLRDIRDILDSFRTS